MPQREPSRRGMPAGPVFVQICAMRPQFVESVPRAPISRHLPKPARNKMEGVVERWASRSKLASLEAYSDKRPRPSDCGLKFPSPSSGRSSTEPAPSTYTRDAQEHRAPALRDVL